MVQGCIFIEIFFIEVFCCIDNFQVIVILVFFFCLGDSDGSIGLDIESLNGLFFFIMWEDGFNSNFRLGFVVGLYSVIFFDILECQIICIFEVLVVQFFEVDMLLSLFSCDVGVDGNIILEVFGSVLFFFYVWEGMFFSNNNMFSNLSVGFYIVVIQDSLGCLDMFEINLQELQFVFDFQVIVIVLFICFGWSDG